MSFPVVIAWAIIAWSVRARHRTLLVLLLASINFSSLALLPTVVTFGMSLLPQLMFATVLICKVLAPEVIRISPKFVNALQLRNLGILALFLLVGIVVTLIMPRLFSEEAIIVPMRQLAGGVDLLSPTQQNFTQSGYITLSVMTVFAVMLMAEEAGFVDSLLVGMLVGGMVCFIAGLCDIVATSSGMEDALKSFRTAEYVYMSDAGTALGGKRVIGFAPEASGYGPVCVQFAAGIAFLRTLYAKKNQRMLAPLVAVGLVIMAVLSTSSTAYGGLAVFAAVYIINLFRRAFFSSSISQHESGLVWEFLIVLGLIIAVLFISLAQAQTLDPFLKLIDDVVLNKSQSDSFYERSFWNTTAWNTLYSTWGLGIGFGSTRTSNWFAAIFSNTGLAGAALMGIFVIQIFIRRSIWHDPLSGELLTALKLSLIPALVMAGVVSASPDFGPWIAVVFGAIAGIGAFRQRRISVDHVVAHRSMPARFRVSTTAVNRAPDRIVPRTARHGAGPP
jgi:hypothetical protein